MAICRMARLPHRIGKATRALAEVPHDQLASCASDPRVHPVVSSWGERLRAAGQSDGVRARPLGAGADRHGTLIMALNPEIALGFRPPQINVDIPSPIQQFATV